MNRWLLGLLLSVLPLASMAGANPFLLTILPHSSTSTQPKSYVPVSVDEGVALRAASLGGGMWVPLPAGGLVYLNYYKSIIHNDGTWTWVGTLSDVQNAPKAFITFGDHAVFGTIPTSSGHLFVLATLRGQAWLADSRDTLTATQAPRLGVLRSPGTTMQADRAFPLAAAAASPSEATPDNPAAVVRLAHADRKSKTGAFADRVKTRSSGSFACTHCAKSSQTSCVILTVRPSPFLVAPASR